MAKLYVVIKVGTQVPELKKEEDLTVVQCEAAFFDKIKAQEYYSSKNKGALREIIENSVFDVVRVIHEVDIIE